MANLETWVVSLGILTLFVILLNTAIIPELNENNNKSYTITGLPTSDFQDRFESYQSDLNTKLMNGTASFTTLGLLSLTTAWDVLVTTFQTIIYFITGGWIETIFTGYLHLSPIISIFIRGIFIISIGFILLKIVFRIKV